MNWSGIAPTGGAARPMRPRRIAALTESFDATVPTTTLTRHKVSNLFQRGNLRLLQPALDHAPVIEAQVALLDQIEDDRSAQHTHCEAERDADRRGGKRAPANPTDETVRA